jgi:hypothetical protein
MSAQDTAEVELDPIEIDPRDCELCGRTIDQHQRIDRDDGPEFYCYADDDIVRLWELADPRDRWRQDGSTPPPEAVRNSIQEWPPKRSYRTAQSVVDAFWFVVSNHDDFYLAAWLKRHPADAAFLIRLWEAKNARKS